MSPIAALKENRRSPPSLDDIEVDLTVLAFQGLLPTMGVAIVSATGLTVTLAIRYRDSFLAAVSVVTLLLCIIRTLVAYRFTLFDNSKLTLAKARRWQAAYGSVTFVHCCVMSVTTFHTFQALPPVSGGLCTMGIYCVCVGLASRTGMRPWIIQSCGAVLLGTLAFSIAKSGWSMSWGGVIIVVFFVYQFSHALQNQFDGAVEQLRIRRQFRALSEQDTLTGLANRRFFESSLGALCASGKPFAILFIDLDRFKHVNDTHGHATGDALLIQVAERLGASIRSSDLLARLGGDEFAILQSPLLPHDAADSASAVAMRINRDIGQPFEIEGHSILIGASIGIRLSATGAADANTLLTKADQALYQVKQAGGGSFSLATA